MSAIEPAGLASQEQSSLTALDAFRRLEAEFLARVESCRLDYAALATENRALAEAAQALAGELFKTSASFAMASALGGAEGGAR